MPPRTLSPRTRKPKTAAKRTATTARSRRDADLRQELEGLYAIDGQATELLITAPPKGRWLRRLALFAPVVVLVHAFIVHGIPWVQALLDRPEFVVFRLGE